MKKPRLILTLTASVLALSACVAPFSAFAGDPDQVITPDSAQQAGNCEVNYTKSAAPEYTYIVTIPASVTITGNTETDKCTVRADEVYLSDDLPKLRIGVSSAHWEDLSDYHRLKLDSDSNQEYIPYTITIGEREIAQGDYVLFVDTGTADVKNGDSAEMCFALQDNDAPAGDYKDVLTFTVSCVASNTNG